MGSGARDVCGYWEMVLLSNRGVGKWFLSVKVKRENSSEQEKGNFPHLHFDLPLIYLLSNRGAAKHLKISFLIKL